jgi:hypothetical protein
MTSQFMASPPDEAATAGSEAWETERNRGAQSRVALNPETVQQDLAKLVLSLVEVVRQLMERQALRRVEGGRLTPDQIERMGLTLMRLEERMDELKTHFGVTGEELRLDLSGLFDEL